jgi:hypothetical protein
MIPISTDKTMNSSRLTSEVSAEPANFGMTSWSCHVLTRPFAGFRLGNSVLFQLFSFIVYHEAVAHIFFRNMHTYVHSHLC